MTRQRAFHALFLLLTGLLLTACATSRHQPAGGGGGRWVKDNRPSLWTENHPRVVAFRMYYGRTTTVETALKRARRYIRDIVPEFRRRRLPLELAYLPMLESMFDPRADSGHARGLWQFTPQTAKHMGLRVSRFRDERLDVRKSTRAAAEYLDRLGEQFNYNWALALAAYNGGPAYLGKAMRRQHSWNFWELRLRQETADYVPRFIAMLQIARHKYPRLIVAELMRGDNPRLSRIPAPQAPGPPTNPGDSPGDLAVSAGSGLSAAGGGA